MKVICFGDSNTWGYDPCSRSGEMYPQGVRWTDVIAKKTGWTIINQGMNGREVPSEAVVIPEDSDLFVVMLGTNDLLQLDTPEATAERMRMFLSDSNIDKVVLIAPPPMTWGDWVQDDGLIEDCITLTSLYKALSEHMGIRFLDAGQWNVSLSYDGVHFTEDGHRVFAEGFIREMV